MSQTSANLSLAQKLAVHLSVQPQHRVSLKEHRNSLSHPPTINSLTHQLEINFIENSHLTHICELRLSHPPWSAKT